MSGGEIADEYLAWVKRRLWPYKDYSFESWRSSYEAFLAARQQREGAAA
jgi:hypothetical protein